MCDRNLCKNCPNMRITKLDGKKNSIRINCLNVSTKLDEFYFFPFPFVSKRLKERISSYSYVNPCKKIQESEWKELEFVKEFKVPEDCPFFLEHLLKK